MPANKQRVCDPCIKGGHYNCLDVLWRQLSGTSCECLQCEKIKANAEEELWASTEEPEDA